MTTEYTTLLTAAVFKVIKDGRLEHFEGNFQNAFLKSADKLGLNRGQKNSFRPTVRTRVKGRVERYQANQPQLTLELVAPPLAPAPPPTPFEPISLERRAQVKALRDRLAEQVRQHGR